MATSDIRRLSHPFCRALERMLEAGRGHRHRGDRGGDGADDGRGRLRLDAEHVGGGRAAVARPRCTGPRGGGGQGGYHSNATMVALKARGLRGYVSESHQGRRSWKRNREAQRAGGQRRCISRTSGAPQGTVRSSSRPPRGNTCRSGCNGMLRGACAGVCGFSCVSGVVWTLRFFRRTVPILAWLM